RRHAEKVAIEFLHVDQSVWCVVNCIDKRKRPGVVRQLDCAGDIVDRTQRVRRRTDRDQFCFWTNKPLEIVPIYLSGIGVESHGANRYTALDRETSPRIDVRMMVQLSDDDLVACLVVQTKRAREMIRQRRHVCAKSNLSWRRV